MNMTNAINIASELIPRQAKRLLSIALLLLCVFSTGTVVHLVQWYAAYTSQEIIRQAQPLFHPVFPSRSEQP
jgi:hypothetical protein